MSKKSTGSRALGKRLKDKILDAGCWILVVLVLEIDVRLQLAGGMGEPVQGLNNVVILILYGLLFACAVY